MAAQKKNDGTIVRTYVLEGGRGKFAGDGTGKQIKLMEYAGNGPNNSKPLFEEYMDGQRLCVFLHAAQEQYGWNNIRILPRVR